MKQSAIYCIKNLLNKKVYVGSTKNIRKREREHFKDLRKGVHHCLHLQNSYETYGEKYFVFCIIEYVDESKLLEQEKRWFQYYSNGDNSKCYNSAKDPSSPMKGKKHTPETIARFSESRKGKKFTKEHKDKIGKALKGRKLAPELREKMRTYRLTHPLTKAQKEHLDRINKDTYGGNNPNAKKVICLDNNKLYSCIQEVIQLEYNSKSLSSAARLGKFCRNHWIYKGKRYCFYEEYFKSDNTEDIINSYTFKPGTRLCPVICEETGQIFHNASNAAKFIGVTYDYFYYHLEKDKVVKENGYTFRRCK